MLYLNYAKPIQGGNILNFFADSEKDLEAVSGGKKFIANNGTDYGVPVDSSTVIITLPDKTKKTYMLSGGEWIENPMLSNLLPSYKYISSFNQSYLFNPLWLVNADSDTRSSIYDDLTFLAEKDEHKFRTTKEWGGDPDYLGKFSGMGSNMLCNVTLGDLQLAEGYKTSWFNDARDKLTVSWPSIRILCKSSIVKKDTDSSEPVYDWILVINNIESKNTPEELASLYFKNKEDANRAGYKYLADTANYDSTDFCILIFIQGPFCNAIVKTTIDSLVSATCFIEEVV